MRKKMLTAIRFLCVLSGCILTLPAICGGGTDAMHPGDPERGVRMPKASVAVFGGSFSVIPPSGIVKDEWRRKFGCEVRSYGVGGAGFAAKSRGAGGTNAIPEQVERVVASGRTHDLYVLWASTNDVWGRTVEEQNAGIEKCVRLIRSSNPAGRIVLFTSSPVPLKANAEPNLGRLVKGQKATCGRLGVPCLDLYEKAGFTVENARPYFGADNLHMNEAGYVHLRKLMTDFIGSNVRMSAGDGIGREKLL